MEGKVVGDRKGYGGWSDRSEDGSEDEYRIRTV